MLRFISFGSGSSGNCYLLQTDNSCLMIDSGVGVRALKRFFHDYGISFSCINNILVTHDHADHVKSVGALSNESGIPVYATEAVHKGIQKNYCVRKKIEPSCVRVIEKGVEYKIDEFKVTPFDVPHDSNDNVGYRIETQGIVFCLMTDIGHVTDDIKANIALADYLVIEANHDEAMLMSGPYPQYLKERVSGPYGHLSNRLCGETVAENASEHLKHVWLCHLSEENNHPELVRKTIETLFHEKGLSVDVDILKRKTPTGFFDLV